MDPAFPNIFLQSMRYIGAGLAMIGASGAGVGIGLVAMGGVQSIGRNPDATSVILTYMLLGIVFSETIAIYAMAMAMIILFV